MKRRVAGLVVAFVVVGCRPIDGGVVVRTDVPATSVPASATAIPSATGASVDFVLQEYPVARGQGPHDVAPARDGGVWYTAQLSGELGWLDPKSGAMAVFDAPRGAGPYGIASCPDGEIYYASLAGNYVGRIVKETGGATVLVPPTAGQGARRAWCDSKSHIWVSEWNAGQLARYDGSSWKEWKLPGNNPMAYAVFVDDADIVWVTDWGANALERFDPATETFVVRTHPSPNANVRELLGRHGEVWGAMSGQDKLVVARPAG